MRKRTLISLILTVVMILPIAGIASAADSWQYYFPITVSDNTGATRTAYPIILEVGGQSLVDGGYLTANGTDARLRTTADKNLMLSSDNIVLVVDTLPAYGQATYNLYTGYSPEIGYFPTIVGDGGSVNVTDAPNLELYDNYTIVQSGWWDTSPLGTSENVSINSAQLSQTGLGGWNAVKLVDGNLATDGFDTDASAVGSWMMIDFGSDNETGLYRWDYQVDAGNTATWNIQYSTDNSSWTTAYTGLDCTVAGWRSATWTPVGEYRYWRSYKTDGANPGNHHNELQVFTAYQKNSIFKTDAFSIYISASENITAEIVGGSSVTAPNISSGEHTITTIADSIFFYIEHGTYTWDDYAPAKADLVLNAPLWHEESSTSPFTTKDVNEHTCTVTTATWDSDTGYSFDGTNDDISCGNDNSLDFTSENFTLIAWVRLSELTSHKAIITRGVENVSGYTFRIPNNEKLWLDTKDAGGRRVNSTAIDQVVADTWYHLVAVRDGTLAVFYKNAVDVPLETAAAIGNPVTNANNFVIGDESGIAFDWAGDIGEVRAYDRALTPAEVLANYNATKWKYDGSGEYFYYQLADNVTDNANDWTLYQNNVLPYSDNTSISINGTLQLWFEPNEMITGTTLPDRATSVANDGTITWGANDGVEIVFGSVTSYETTTSAASVNETGFVLPLVGIPDNWWGMEFDGEDLPFYPTFLDTSTGTGIPVQTLYLLLVFGAAIALATVTIVLTRSVVVGVAFYTVTMAYGANAGIVAWWIIYVFLIMVVGIIFLSSRQAMGS